MRQVTRETYGGWDMEAPGTTQHGFQRHQVRALEGVEAISCREVYGLLSTGNITIPYGRIASPNDIPNATIMTGDWRLAIGVHEFLPSLLPQCLPPLPVFMILFRVRYPKPRYS